MGIFHLFHLGVFSLASSGYFLREICIVTQPGAVRRMVRFFHSGRRVEESVSSNSRGQRWKREGHVKGIRRVIYMG